MLRATILALIFLACIGQTPGVAAAKYPWNLAERVVPTFRILETENPIKDEFMVTYTVLVCADKASTRDEIKTMGEKIIEGLPPHNMAIICFVADPSEKPKDWTLARIWWGPSDASLAKNDFSQAGDYSRNIMKIAMKGQQPPGDVVENY